MNASPKVRVLTVDDHPVIRAGLSAFLGTEVGVEVVAEASNGEEALERYRELRPDIVLMDLSMPVMDGLTATRAILDESPDARILVLTTYNEDEDIHRALAAGARGYLLKDMLPGHMAEVIRAVAQGRKGVPPAFTAEYAPRLAGRYRRERELGRGGMATVYLSHDLRHDRYVALKVMRPELAASVGSERFLREIRTTARLQHPHILPVLDSGEAAGQLWYTMPFVEGESLRDRLYREHQLPLEDALQITREVADALGYAHSQGVVHRDIKPENILLSRSHALVADFGIARVVQVTGSEQVTETGLVVGTPSYMSPEQCMAEPTLDGRSDLYSLGCVLYEMLAGEVPYTGTSAQAIFAKRLREPVPHVQTVRETVPPEVDRALQVVLAKMPADRFHTAEEFACALSAAPVSGTAAGHRPGTGAPETGTEVGIVLPARSGWPALWRRLVRRGGPNGPDLP